jgi:hypothetical protein
MVLASEIMDFDMTYKENSQFGTKQR